MAFSLDQFYRLNRRALIWIVLGALIWLMRDFFGLVFLTFILAFITAPLATLGVRYLYLNRRISIIITYGIFLIALVSFARYVTPSVIREANEIIKKLPQIQDKISNVKNQAMENNPSLGPLIAGYMRSVLSEGDKANNTDYLAKVDAELKRVTDRSSPAVEPESGSTTATASIQAKKASAKYIRDNLEQDLLIKTWMNIQAGKVAKYAPEFASVLYRLTGTMLLALLFSFLITMDIARLREEVESLRASRLHDFYEQAAQPVVRFAYVLGRSFQAQAIVALVNTALTVFGLAALGIPSLAVISLIVFFCSFIPVLGVFISSVPILLVALNSSDGLYRALAAVALIVVIHFIVMIVLNPIVYGKHLKLNPVLVLLILFVGHHAFGIWGMILGVPVAYYFIHDVFGVPVWGEKRMAPRGGPRQPHPLGTMPQSLVTPQKNQSPEPAARAGKSKTSLP